MPGVSLESIDSAGGALISANQSFVTANGLRVIVMRDPVTPHGQPPHSPAPTMAQGLPWFTINGIPVVVAGMSATCGHTATGQTWFTAG